MFHVKHSPGPSARVAGASRARARRFWLRTQLGRRRASSRSGPRGSGPMRVSGGVARAFFGGLRPSSARRSPDGVRQAGSSVRPGRSRPAAWRGGHCRWCGRGRGVGRTWVRPLGLGVRPRSDRPRPPGMHGLRSGGGRGRGDAPLVWLPPERLTGREKRLPRVPVVVVRQPDHGGVSPLGALSRRRQGRAVQAGPLCSPCVG